MPDTKHALAIQRLKAQRENTTNLVQSRKLNIGRCEKQLADARDKHAEALAEVAELDASIAALEGLS